MAPLALGAGLAVAGGLTTALGAGMGGTQPSRTLIGGTTDGAADIQNRNAGGLQGGQNLQQQGALGLQGTNAGAQNLIGLGGSLVADGQQNERFARMGVQNAASGLGQFQSNAANVGSAVGQQTLDAGRAQALSLAGGARGGNLAAAFRGAQAANTQMGAQAAAQSQITAGQQQMAQDAMRLQAMQAAGGLRMGMLNQAGSHIGQGLGAQQAGLGLQQNVGSQLLGAGLQREGNFLAAQTGNESLQAQLDQQTELAQAQAQARKQQNVMGLGGGLLGAGGQVLGGQTGGG